MWEHVDCNRVDHDKDRGGGVVWSCEPDYESSGTAD
jgi:hypothetical protein